MRSSGLRPCAAAGGAALGALLLLAAAVVWFGLYDVSARSGHWAVTERLLDFARRRSVEVRSRDLARPPLDSPERLQRGLGHFAGMCPACHGAPGHEPAEFAQGLYPAPPDLGGTAVQALDPEAIYWVVSNGLKMTGMPAFGTSHGEEDLWGLVAVVRRLPKLSPAEYEQLREQAPHHASVPPAPRFAAGAQPPPPSTR